MNARRDNNIEFDEIKSAVGRVYESIVVSAFEHVNGDAADAPKFYGWLREKATGKYIGEMAEGKTRTEVRAILWARVRKGSRR